MFRRREDFLYGLKPKVSKKTVFDFPDKQTWGQLLLNVMHYITITFKIIALHYDYNYRGFDNVMHYITITSQSNALHYNYLKGFRTLFIYIMKCHAIQTIPSKTLKHLWPSGKTTILVNQRL